VATQNEVVTAGLQLLVMLYGGKEGDTLDHLRYAVYMNLIATGKTRPRPERLPATERAAAFHVMRAHLQIVQWKSLMSVCLDPEDWGWSLKGGQFMPIQTDLKPAPEELLSVITCRCKITTRRPCSTQMCSCFKHGLHCVAACKHCCGEECGNVSQLTLVDVNQEDDEADELHDSVTEELDVFGDEVIGWVDEEVLGSTVYLDSVSVSSCT